MLAQAGSLQVLINELARTAYRPAVEVALVLASPLDCVTEALHQDLMMTLNKARAFYSGRAGELVTAVLRAYEVQNLKTILRGLSKQATVDEMSHALVPVGELGPGVCAELARAHEPREAIDRLASMRLPIAQPLLKLRGEQPGADLFAMELALERWYHEQALEAAQRSPSAAGVLVSALDLEADITNLLIALRFAHAPAERRALPTRRGDSDLTPYFVRPGLLSLALLAMAGEQNRVQDALSFLATTRYREPLALGMEAYAQSGQLGDLEKRLRCFRLRRLAGFIAKDPLGIGVVLGYLALKTGEVANIRWIANGLYLGLELSVIQQEIEFAP